MSNLFCLFVCVLSACAPTETLIYRQCKEQVEAINKMRLYVAYLVPVDSLGQYMNDEVISDEMYDHCDVVASVNPYQVHTFAILYFDNMGKVRKSIEWWSDGGDLRNVGYYDGQGNIIYAAYNYYDDNCGKLYAVGSERHVEHPFTQSHNGNGLFLPPLTITELASRYKAHLLKPDSCNAVSFLPIQKGDEAYLCTTRVYTTPQKDMTKSEEVRWGGLVVIDSLVDGWCSVRIPTYETPIGYIPVDSIELGVKENSRRKL